MWKGKSTLMKSDRFYKHAFWTYLYRLHLLPALSCTMFSSAYFVYQRWSIYTLLYVYPIRLHLWPQRGFGVTIVGCGPCPSA